MTLYLKYRPQKISDLDLVGVRESLTKLASSKNNIPHAILFSGPKGTGKTSAARILAKLVNCESNSKILDRKAGNKPCNKCESCRSINEGSSLDIIELDAASHRGIDDVRAIRDAAKLLPSKLDKKVYIIDEAHMLTTEACNALLKILEEPPSHVIFILATTNPEKILETIKSRTTLIKFPKATIPELVSSLKKIVSGEKFSAKDDVLEEIATASDGSFRDAAKILEQLITEKVKLSPDGVKTYLRKSTDITSVRLFESLIANDIAMQLSLVEEYAGDGGDISGLIINLMQELKSKLLSGITATKEVKGNFTNLEITKLIKILTKAYEGTKYSPIEQLPLEIALVEWAEIKGKIRNTDDMPSQKSSNETGEQGKMNNSPNTKSFSPVNEKKIKLNSSSGITAEIWQKILGEVKPLNTVVEALLRAAKPIDYDGKTLKLGVFYRFHKERLEESKNLLILEQVIEKVLTAPTRVVCVLTQPVKETMVQAKAVLNDVKDEDIVKIAKDVFGS